MRVLGCDISAPREEDSSPRRTRRTGIHKEASLFVVFVSFVVANLSIWLRPTAALSCSCHVSSSRDAETFRPLGATLKLV